MKFLVQVFCMVLLGIGTHAQNLNGTEADRQSLEAATLAIRNAFAKGDAALAASLHHPDIVKYFGGANVVTGRPALEKGLAEWFRTDTIEFVENTVETTIFSGDIAIQTCIFSIRATPKGGGNASVTRGRAMVTYIRATTSPTGWLTIREMAQAAPEKEPL